MPPIVTVRRSRSDSAIDQAPGIAPCSVGPGSEPGPELTSLVYSVIVAANERTVPSERAEIDRLDGRRAGERLHSCRYFTSAKYEPSPLAETEMLENPPDGSGTGVAGVRLKTCTPATAAEFRRKRITPGRSAVGGTFPSISRIVASFSGASSRACSSAFSWALKVCCSAFVSSSSPSAVVTSAHLRQHEEHDQQQGEDRGARTGDDDGSPTLHRPLPPPAVPAPSARPSVRSTPDVYVIGPFSGSAIDVTHGLTQPRTRSSRVSHEAMVS